MYHYQISRTGSNIHALREAFGETQLDLAAALGFDSPAAISMYESGSRGQNRVEILDRIAHHYQITLDELLHNDFSTLHKTIESLGWKISDPENPSRISTEKIRALLQTLYPAACSETALGDPLFRDAYQKHIHALQDLPWTGSGLNRFHRTCMEQYTASFQENKTVESAVNILWWHTVWAICVNYPEVLPAFSQFCRSEISWTVFVRRCWLRDELLSEQPEVQADNPTPRTGTSETQTGTSGNNIRDLTDRTALSGMPLTKILSASAKWYQWTEYNQALLYTLGITSCILPGSAHDTLHDAAQDMLPGTAPEITCPENTAAAVMSAGRYMMAALSQAENPYARRFISFLQNPAESVSGDSRINNVP